jgi:hypothetical protein
MFFFKRQLRDAFLTKAIHGYSNYDRQLRLVSSLNHLKKLANFLFITYRNDILVISNLLASYVPKLPFIETGMAKQLLLFSTYPECKRQSYPSPTKKRVVVRFG